MKRCPRAVILADGESLRSVLSERAGSGGSAGAIVPDPPGQCNRTRTGIMRSHSIGGMNMTKVLFLCVHNSARSQMAEAFLKKYGGERFLAESAGLEPGVLNPYVVRAMTESGIDISGNQTKSVFDLFNAGRVFQVVITVCSREAAERCPIFPGLAERHHWPFADPSTFTGSDDEIMAKVREVRDEIRDAVMGFLNRGYTIRHIEKGFPVRAS